MGRAKGQTGTKTLQGHGIALWWLFLRDRHKVDDQQGSRGMIVSDKREQAK